MPQSINKVTTAPAPATTVITDGATTPIAPLAPIPVPTPRPKVNMAVKINASFDDLGLNDADKKAAFSRDFEVSMSKDLGLKVIVNDVTAGEALIR